MLSNIKLFQTLVVWNKKILLGKWKSGAFKGRISGCLGQTLNEKETLSDAGVRVVNDLTGLILNPSFIQVRAYFTFFEQDAQTPSAQMLGDQYHEYQLHYDGDRYEQVEKQNLNNIKETELFIPQWFNINEIPYNQMPEDDIHWYPLFLKGDILSGEFIFQGTQLLNHKLNIEKEIHLKL